MTPSVRVVKGHGTGNDFVVIDDPDGTVALSPELVRALCDRHTGVGADGVLRVLRTELATEPDVRAQADTAPYFMDYHNADGSLAEMCGNGVRVFARYLADAGRLADDAVTTGFDVATRGGPRAVRFQGPDVAVRMGRAQPRPESPTVSVAGLVGDHPGRALQVPNPHVVVEVESVAALEALDLGRAPHVSPALPDGQNVEFIVRTGPHALQMRVHERGVGETRSCGTGIVAAVAVASGSLAGAPAPTGQVWTVDVPGGRCEVSWQDDELVLAGPAELVADLRLRPEWLGEHR